MNIIESINSKKLFLNFFDDLNTWRAWQVYLVALFGLEMTAAEKKTYKKHTGNRYRPGKVSQTSYVLSGRRSGKSIISSLLACYLATYQDWSTILSPGEQGYVFLIANDRDQALGLKRYISGILSISPELKWSIKKELAWEIQLNNGITIAVRTKNFRTLRGYTVIAAILEEVAFWRSEESANPDLEVLAAVRPAMLTVKDSMLIGISSAYAKRGLLYDQYRKFYGKAAGPLIWKSSTMDMNPIADKKQIAEDIKSDPARYKSEYFTEFRGDIESYLGIDDIERITANGVYSRPYDSKYKYYAFCDPSGGRVDSMTLGIAHKEKAGKIIQDVLGEQKPPFKPSEVVAKFSETLEGYRINRITSDRADIGWIKEAFSKHRILVEISKLSASDLYAAFIPIVMNKAAVLLDNKRMKNQLSNLERKTQSGGKDKIDHPAGSHDDLANAAAGVIATIATPSAKGMALGWRADYSEPGEQEELDDEDRRIRRLTAEELDREIEQTKKDPKNKPQKEDKKRLEKEKKFRGIGYKKWKKDREDWFEYYKKNPGLDSPGGELANILDFLTPDGYDKEGKKVGFVEEGEPFGGNRLLSDISRSGMFKGSFK